MVYVGCNGVSRHNYTVSQSCGSNNVVLCKLGQREIRAKNIILMYKNSWYA